MGSVTAPHTADTEVKIVVDYRGVKHIIASTTVGALSEMYEIPLSGHRVCIRFSRLRERYAVYHVIAEKVKLRVKS